MGWKYTIFLLWLIAAPVSQAQLFERAGPVVWSPLNHYVQSRISAKRLEITIDNPCNEIPTVLTHPLIGNLKARDLRMMEYVATKCHETYKEEITDELKFRKQ